MRVVIAPDSFKGSLSAQEVAVTIAAAANKEWPDLECDLLVEQALHRSLQNLPGAGAAGGLGFALMAIGAHTQAGAALVGAAMDLENKLAKSHFAITGEGQSDEQTLHGKVPVHVADTAAKLGVRTILLSGSLGENYEALYSHFASIHSTIPRPMTLEMAMADAQNLLFQAARNLFRLLRP